MMVKKNPTIFILSVVPNCELTSLISMDKQREIMTKNNNWSRKCATTYVLETAAWRGIMTLDMCPCLFKSADSVLLLWALLLLQHLNEYETACYHNNAQEGRGVCVCWYIVWVLTWRSQSVLSSRCRNLVTNEHFRLKTPVGFSNWSCFESSSPGVSHLSERSLSQTLLQL